MVCVQISNAIALAVGSTILAAAGADGTVAIVRLRNLHVDAVLAGPGRSGTPTHKGPMSPRSTPHASSDRNAAVGVCISPDQGHLVVQCDGAVACHELQERGKQRLAWSAAAHHTCVWALAASARRIATASKDGTVHLWERGGDGGLQPLCTVALKGVAAPPRVRLQCLEDAPVGRAHAQTPQLAVPRAAAFSSDGGRLAIGDQSGVVRVFDAASGGQLDELAAHEGLVRSLAFSAEPFGGRPLLASGGDDGLVHVCDVAADHAILQTLNEHDGVGITAIAFTGAAGMVSCAQDCKIVFRCASSVPSTPRNAHSRLGIVETRASSSMWSAPVWRDCSPCMPRCPKRSIQQMMCGHASLCVCRQHVAGVFEVSRTVSMEAVASDVAYLPALKAVATVGQDKQLRLWHPVTGQPQQCWPLPCRGAPSKLAASAGNAIACGFQDGTVLCGP